MHRLNIMLPGYRRIGIGWQGAYATCDFGSAPTSAAEAGTPTVQLAGGLTPAIEKDLRARGKAAAQDQPPPGGGGSKGGP